MSQTSKLPAMIRRFAEVARARSMAPPAPAPEGVRAPALAQLSTLDPATLAVTEPARADLETALAVAVDTAFAQGDVEGVSLLVAGLGWIAGMASLGNWILHGTGSWALASILTDGAVRAGGDGMTGEVAITGVLEPDVFVLRWGSPLSLYSAAAFAYMNAGYRRDTLRLSALRQGRPHVGDLLAELAFPLAEGSYLDASPRLSEQLTRHRLLGRDAHFRQALANLEQRLEQGDTAWTTEPMQRSMTVNDADAAQSNVQFAVQRQLQTEPSPTSEAQTELARVTRASRRVIGFLRSCLLCSDPETPAELQAHTTRAARELADQHPVILIARTTDHDCRPDPSYHWSDERRIPGSLALGSITHVLVPQSRMADLERCGPPVGLQAEILPLEYFEALRLVAENVG